MIVAGGSPAIPPGSLVVVIGANGYIGVETSQKFLEAGYRVRGAPGVLYVSTPIIFNPDRAKVLEPNVNGTINILKAAARTKVQRFVLNSSSKSVEKTVYNQPHELTTETFNYEALQKARYEPASPTFERTLDVYSAGRTAAELAFWSWIKDKKPPFVANCVVPDGNFGRVLGHEHIGQTSSFGMLKGALAGQWKDIISHLAYYIDVEDTARLLVAAVTAVIHIVAGEDLDIQGRDLSTAHELIQRSKRILQEVGQSEFVSEDDMQRKFVESMYKDNE
ncbi:hypothetical protein CIB48_g10646 [Xylaria polymorpha]|nr:hypothetical protein CIB48_g10646 [Xylaria polymorpha]